MVIRSGERGPALDAAIAARAGEATALLARLVASPSELGAEHGAQRLLGAALEDLGFAVAFLPVPEGIGDDASAGVPQMPYAGRGVLVARRAPTGDATMGRTLVVNGHLDVVPPGDLAAWTSPPYEPQVRDGWMYGRGAGDMKGGIAMAVLAIGALLDVCADALAGELVFVGSIEEECTGNGTLASVRAGVLADAALLPEPTDLALLTSGIGVLWLEATLRARAGHAHAGSEGGVLAGICELRQALADVEDRLNAGLPERPYRIVVGRVEAGDWPSSVPGSARVAIRVGFPSAWTPKDAQERVSGLLTGALPRRTASLELRPNGFRAAGYAQGPAALLDVLSAAHADAHGSVPELEGVNATTDARFYVRDAGIPAVCFGPRARDIHGPDEAVELASVVAGARTASRFMAEWLSTTTEDAWRS